jgi:hypothetical protein
MEMQLLYLVVAVLFAIHQIALLIAFIVMAGYYPRQLQPEPEKSVVGAKVGTKVDQDLDKMTLDKEQVDAYQNDNPELLKDHQPREAILTIGSLPDAYPVAMDQELESPEPVSEPKDILTKVTCRRRRRNRKRRRPSPSNEQLETDEKRPACLSPEMSVLLIVFLDFVVGLYWGQFIDILTCTFSTRQLQPVPEKSVVGENIGTKVKEPKEIQAEELETCQNNPTELKDQPREAIQTIDSLPDVNQHIDNQPRHKAEDLAMGYQWYDTTPNKFYPWSFIKEVSSTFGSQTKPRINLRLLESFKPEKPDLVAGDNQFRHKPGDPQVLPKIPEKSGPKDIPAEVIPPSNEQLETNEKKPEPESLTKNLQKTIVNSTGNVTNEDPVGETQLLEIAEETINPEKIERAEQQPQEAQSQSTDKDQSTNGTRGISRQQSRLQTKRQIAEETSSTGLSKLMDEYKGDNSVLMAKNSEMTNTRTNRKIDNVLLNTKDLLTENEHSIEIDKTPKHVEMRILRGANFPEAKDSDKYYVSVRVEQWRGIICDQDKKIITKTIRGSQPEWNKDITIKTQNPEGCFLTIKVKKSSKFGLNKSTVGFVKLYVSSLDDDVTETMQLYDEDHNPVGEACLKVKANISDLPEVIFSPAEDKRKLRKTKAKMIFSKRHREMYGTIRINQILDDE